MKERIVALCGGVGGAKLALGLTHVLAAGELTVLVNTGDDFEHLGLSICPDLDTVLYTLSGEANPETGWGRQQESWNFIEALAQLGGEDWFQLGDRDMATHIMRSQWLAAGVSLTGVVQRLCAALQIKHTILPMTDDPVRTRVHTRSGEILAFQHYFVRDRCAPEVTGFEFHGADSATLPAAVKDALGQASGIIICPSNPFVSIDPILSVPGMTDAMLASGAPIVAVSPIVGGEAIKGPTAKMMRELQVPDSTETVAAHYKHLLHGFIVDEVDRQHCSNVRALGLDSIAAQTVMSSLTDKINLAQLTLGYCRQLRS